MKIYENLPSGIKIVDYAHSFASSLAEMFNACTQNEDEDWGGESGISTASQVISEHEAASHFNVYLALDGDEVVGYCSFGRYYADANTLYIPLLGVRPDYRNKKVGKALVLRCVQRTIELGYPRLDLFTWSGNTAAVPLYKKCGFLWEDRTDGVHFVNFVPTIVTLPIFGDFFAKADWYADSTRSLEIVPDGAKTNGFELFGYTWGKDGDTLAIGYERSGRQMRMIETNDYKIELLAKEHELAFGMDYTCTFAIENKTGKPLHIKINGRKDGCIRLDCQQDLKVASKQNIDANFYVGPISEPQDPWKVHPCVMADVEINGHKVTFGLGIQPKFPLLVEFTRECTVDQVGMDVKTYIGIQSALLEDATLQFSIPKNNILGIGGGPFTVNIPAKGKASVQTTATTLAIGFEKLELHCDVTIKSGTFNITVPSFISTRDMAQAYAGEDLHCYRICNGPWLLELMKDSNEVKVSHLLNKGYDNEYAFQPPKFGKPYDDEFNLIKPRVKTYRQAGTMIMEAEFVSEKFHGLVVTQVYNLHATGLITRTNRVENRGDKPRHTMMQDKYGIPYGFNSMFSYNGQITQNHVKQGDVGAALEGFDNISPDGFDENWFFEDSPTAPRGVCWPMEYKLAIQWGVYLMFDIDLNQLAPGQTVETKPVTFALGLFTNFNDMRNYARQLYNPSPGIPVHMLEVKLNEYNPFTTGSNIKLDIVNNRDEVQEGTITISSQGLPAPISQTNPHEDIVECNSFELPLNPADIAIVNINMAMVGYEKAYNRALFFPSGRVTTSQEDTSYCVSNGVINFKADPNYGNGCYSLTDAKGQEWLHSQYPEHKPHSWFNPFIGGMRVRADGITDDRAMLKEKITAGFVELWDNFGNLWQGICSTLSISEDEQLKGSVYKSYFLTQPGLPVVCTFYQFINNTGQYRSDTTWLSTCLKPDDDAKNIITEIIDRDGNKHRRRMGSLDTPEFFYEGTMQISSSRAEKLYAICRTNGTECGNDFWGSNKIAVMATFSQTKAHTAHGEIFTSNPGFLVITDQQLPQDALCDLERIKF